MKDTKGFTLIEVIVTLTLVGIIAVFATYGVLQVTRGYIQGVTHNDTSKKGSIALARIFRELSQLYWITGATDSAIAFSRGDSTRVGLAFDESTKTLRMDENPADFPLSGTAPILVDDVTSFSLSYFKSDGLSWALPDGIEHLAKIKVLLMLDSHPSPVQFQTSISIMYNRTYNGPYDD